MPFLVSLLSVAALWAVAVVTPGPNFLVTARLAVEQTRMAGLQAVMGIGIGTAVWAAAGFFGVHELFAAVPWMYAVLKTLGGSYLLLLGVRLLWNSGRAADTGSPVPERPRSGLSAFRLGLVTNLANPKSALFVTSVFATAMPDNPPLALGLMAMAVMVAISVGWYAVVACLFTTRPVADVYRRGRRWVDRVAGAVFVLFGAKLVASR